MELFYSTLFGQFHAEILWRVRVWFWFYLLGGRLAGWLVGWICYFSPFLLFPGVYIAEWSVAGCMYVCMYVLHVLACSCEWDYDYNRSKRKEARDHTYTVQVPGHTHTQSTAHNCNSITTVFTSSSSSLVSLFVNHIPRHYISQPNPVRRYVCR